MSNNMNIQTTIQWHALRTREQQASYKVSNPISSTEAQDGRCIVVKWAYRVVDNYGLDRSVVAFAFSYFDRFMDIHANSVNFEFGQLLALTCLYLGAKLQSRRSNLSVARLIRLSRGHFKANQVFDMEKCVVKTLAWYLNPPVPALYLETVRPLLYKNIHISIDEKDGIYDMTVFLIELSVCDHYFVTKKPSSIAAAALQVALEFVGSGSVLQVPDASDLQMTDDCAKRLRKLHSVATLDRDEASRYSDSSPTDVVI